MAKNPERERKKGSRGPTIRIGGSNTETHRPWEKSDSRSPTEVIQGTEDGVQQPFCKSEVLLLVLFGRRALPARDSHHAASFPCPSPSLPPKAITDQEEVWPRANTVADKMAAPIRYFRPSSPSDRFPPSAGFAEQGGEGVGKQGRVDGCYR